MSAWRSCLVSPTCASSLNIHSVQAATSAPLIERSIERATGIVYNITGGSDLTLQEVGWSCVPDSELSLSPSRMAGGRGVLLWQPAALSGMQQAMPAAVQSCQPQCSATLLSADRLILSAVPGSSLPNLAYSLEHVPA